jgi:hypothetical protein
VTVTALRLGKRLHRSQDIAEDVTPDLDHEMAGS